MSSARYFYTVLTKFGFFGEIFIQGDTKKGTFENPQQKLKKSKKKKLLTEIEPLQLSF